ncbi:Dam family site-specific DNA-(adenine-N6)-methyltransferase [Spiroplasma alleghenense]|uniref:Site-specific DNA-methyltransferase (adenine-specific) n=1 Tax=Spiroplasma alleghenense TaxID=216931 RepID=A0A345Z4T7_9MOLU|nr:Dam family site-specific DNA-(adenine-N6)-methyltransferase [Spiroplasma alleghenense]AXK51616.1 DNA adenine methylase [Spiroplasma alleghenense]
MDKYIKSPINYTGNKFRILDQIFEKLPKNKHKFIDLFCGGATVGINSNYDEVIFIDKNPYIINLLSTLANNDINKIINKIKSIIQEYNLSYSAEMGYKYYSLQKSEIDNNGLKFFNKQGYYKLREDYNSTKNKNSFDSNLKLYLLIIYGFNNDIRFNNSGGFNLPVGKTDFNKNNLKKITEFNLRAKGKKFIFMQGSFEDEEIEQLVFADSFVYMDPPYLITTAFYNENKGWNLEEEKKLLSFMDKLIKNETPFALSNIISRDNAINQPLFDWIKGNQELIEIHEININYSSASYNKLVRYSKDKEILLIGGLKNGFKNRK